MSATHTKIYLPDRFDMMRDRVDWNAFVDPVDAALEMIDGQFDDFESSGHGSLVILRGQSGAGKTTFLTTIPLFRPGVQVERLQYGEDIGSSLRQIPEGDAQRIVIVEGREAVGKVSDSEIEHGLHGINSFLREDPRGARMLIVWPTNTDDLADKLATVADQIGASSLIGTDEPVFNFSGPPKSDWPRIVARTVASLNLGAQLTAYGISSDDMDALLEESNSLGHLVRAVRKRAIKNTGQVGSLMKASPARVWSIVVSASDNENDVAALTRGSFSDADIDKTLSATQANIVAELKKTPEKIGLLGTVLDARVIHMDPVVALAVARTFGSPALKAKMASKGMATLPTKNDEAVRRISESHLGILLAGKSLGPRKVGGKIGSNTVDAMTNLTNIASTSDVECNRAFGEALKKAGLISHFEVEDELRREGTSLKSDLLTRGPAGEVRIEFMWRKKTGRADIANYVLGKLRLYGKVVGYLD